MSLLRKLSYCDEFFSKTKQGDKLGMTGGEVQPHCMRTSSRITEEEVKAWSVEKATELGMLKNWLKKQPHLPQNLADEQLLLFLHVSWNSVEQAKMRIDNHFTMRTHAPEIFTRRDVASKEILQALRIARISPLQNATPEGYNAIFIDCIDPDVENFDFTTVLKAAAMAIDTLVKYCPREENNVLVFDMRNSVMAHVLKTNLVTLKKAMLYVQKSLPFRLHKIHVINAFPLIHQIQTLLKPFIDSELSKQIHIHMQDSPESFYKFIPQKNLPKEYGGEAASLQELNDVLKEMLNEQAEYLKSQERQVVDESRRAGRAKSSGDVFGVEGSFRKLELD